MHSTVGDLYLPPNALHCWGSLFTAQCTPLLGIFIYALMHSTVGDLYLRLNALHCWGYKDPQQWSALGGK